MKDHRISDLFEPRPEMDSDYPRGGGASASDGDFGFAFNDSNFSDRLLRIEIMGDHPECRAGGDCASIADWARHRKRRREDIKKENVLDLSICPEEQILTDNQPDMDDGACENQDEEPDAMLEESASGGETELQAEDESFLGGSDEEFDEDSELNREWKSRHDQFHTMGYRDGLIAGKEAAAQEGFNIGFKQSVRCGYNWGRLRGVTSALECLASELKEVLVESQDRRNNFLGLYTSVHSIPTVDALKLCLEDLTTKEAEEKGEPAETSDDGLERQISDGGQMGKYFRELKALLIESPKIESGFD